MRRTPSLHRQRACLRAFCLIYDNDWWFDVFDNNYLWSAGQSWSCESSREYCFAGHVGLAAANVEIIKVEITRRVGCLRSDASLRASVSPW